MNAGKVYPVGDNTKRSLQMHCKSRPQFSLYSSHLLPKLTLLIRRLFSAPHPPSSPYPIYCLVPPAGNVRDPGPMGRRGRAPPPFLRAPTHIQFSIYALTTYCALETTLLCMYTSLYTWYSILWYFIIYLYCILVQV